MARRKPEGIIDDIFLPLGKKAVHEVRSAVREINRQSGKAQQKRQAAQRLTEQRKSRHAKELKQIEARLVRNMNKRATPAGKKKAGTNTVVTGRAQQEKMVSPTKARKIASADAYERNVRKLSSSVEKRFPSREAFERALKEEARDVKRFKQAQAKNVPAKKAPAKKAPAKKAPAKKAASTKKPGGK